MDFEIALLAWSERHDQDGVRCLGRTRDPHLVEAVREHLIQRLDATQPNHLRVIRGANDGSEDEG